MKQLSVTREERRWFFGFAVFLAALTTIPYLIAFSNQGEEWVFTGFLFGVEDGNSYIAKMLTGAQGAWLFRSPYSAAQQQGALIYLPYLLIGKILGASATHSALIVLYHLFRVASIFALCSALYNFFALFLEKQNLRKLGLVLASLGGGVGWLALALGQANWLNSLPLDFYSPETFGFLAIYGLPHLTLARALLFTGLLNYLQVDGSNSKKHRRKIVVLWLSLALVHLLAAGIGFMLLASHLAVVWLRGRRQYAARKKQASVKAKWEYAICAQAGIAFPVLYNIWVFLNDGYLRAWAAQNLIPSPHPLHYLLAYGLLLPFVFIGGRHLLKINFNAALFPIIWLGLLPILLYSPFGVQRRFAEGAWVALLVLALAAFEAKPLQKWQNWRWIFAALIPSTLIILIGTVQLARSPRLPAFRPSTEIQAFDELREQSNSGELVLSSFTTGNALPAWVPLRVVIGHGPETISFANLLPQVNDFYSGGMGEEEKEQLLRAFDVDYFFWGPNEADHSAEPIDLPLSFEKFVDIESYKIYKISED